MKHLIIFFSALILSFSTIAQEIPSISSFYDYFAMGGGGDIGGTGHVATKFTPIEIQAINLIKNGGQIVAIGGGGDIGGTGKTINSLIINGKIISVEHLDLYSRLKDRITIKTAATLIDDLEMKNGAIIPGAYLEEIVTEKNNHESIIAIAAEEINMIQFLDGNAIVPHQGTAILHNARYSAQVVEEYKQVQHQNLTEAPVFHQTF